MIDCTPFVETLGGKAVAVFGLGVSGLATVEALIAAEAKVIVWDDREEAREKALALGAQAHELTTETLKDCACLVLAPGVPLHFPEPHPVVIAAREADVEILCDIEILHRVNHSRNIPRKTIGITGTNGKSTTTALIHHILNECNFENEMGGNIGVPAMSMDMPDRGGVLVLEMSSYQIDLCPKFTPEIAVLLNITPDHLDRHGSMEGYVAAKARMFEGGGHAIISAEDMHSWQINEQVKDAAQREIIPLKVGDDCGETFNAPALKGKHNIQNIKAAWFVCKLLGIEKEAFLKALQSFPGLNHRQYHVRKIGKVTFINDSKATNAEAAAKALGAYDNIYWIVGGQAKDGGLKGLEPYKERIKHAFLIGQSQVEFEDWMRENEIAYSLSGTLEAAVKDANALSAEDQVRGGEAEAVVLLSPACASWDQFKNFEDRGNQFSDLVAELEGDESAEQQNGLDAA